VKLAAWNIRHGGGSRRHQIVASLKIHDPDIIILSEFRTAPGRVLCDHLAAEGWTCCESTQPDVRNNGICVVSRTPFRRVPARNYDWPEPRYWIHLEILESDVSLTGLHLPHVPSLLEKRRYWAALLRAAQEQLPHPSILIGDFNTGCHREDEESATLRCADDFATLSESGWTDAWRHFHGSARQFTWFSHRRGGAAGNGFRLDHAFVSPSLLPRLVACDYSHAEREQKISDHSILLLEITAKHRP
jgi:exodeoxyribonuclease-3